MPHRKCVGILANVRNLLETAHNAVSSSPEARNRDSSAK